jgi:signal transduction histidine kinase
MSRRVRGTRSWSIRARVTAVATVLLALVLGASGAAIVLIQRQQLMANLDDALEQRADDIADAVAAGDDAHPHLANTNDEDRLAQLVALDGTIVAATPNLAGHPPVAREEVSGQTIGTVDDLPVEDDTFRLLSRRIVTPQGPAVLYVAENTDDLEDSIRYLIWSLVIAVPATVMVLGALVWWLVSRTLRPVEAIRAEVADISAAALDRRVPQPPGRDEIARLARTMNAMLDRLEESTDRQHRFVADASHELRGPLTRIRTELDVALSDPRRADDAEVLRSVLAEAEAMQHLVADLLALARADAGTGVARRVPVDLDDIVIREARRMRAAGHRIDLDQVSAAHLLGDPDQLVRLVRNLLENAVRHAASRVWMELREIEDSVTLVVADDGPGIPIDQRARVFQRFARLDEARVRDDGGTGLGLAIVREIAVGHGGTVTVDDAPGGGALFTVQLPAAP